MARSRPISVGLCALMAVSVFVPLFLPAASATAGRDSPAAAFDGSLGPFQGYFDGSVFVGPGPPVVEDWYKYNVIAGQIFQVSLWIQTGGTVSVYHQNPSDPNALFGFDRAGNDVGCGIGLASVDLVINTTEIIYIKISPAGGGAMTQYYNLAMRAFYAPILGDGDSFSPAADANAIHGWARPNFIGPPTDCFIYLPELYTTDYYWVNATDAVGSNHRNYRVRLDQTCSTAMYDVFLYQYLDAASNRLDLLNHSLAMERRADPRAPTTVPNSFDFAPVQYDGNYLVAVRALENGSWSVNSGTRYRYTVTVTTLGGLSKDGNDRWGDGPVVNLSSHVTGHIDGRDDSVDWFRFNLVKGDTASLSVSFTRANNEIATWGLRYRALVFDPNGTVVQDVSNWGFSGPTPYFYPYLTVPSISAQLTGTYVMQLATVDGGLNSGMQLTNTQGLGRNWADYDANFVLPNRPPVAQRDPLWNITPWQEDTSTIVNLAGWFADPEAKFSYPQYVVDPTYATKPGVNFNFTMAGTNLTIIPRADWYGTDLIPILVKDDVPLNTQKAWLNVTVLPVNDPPRVYGSAGSLWSVIGIPEDGATTVPLREIFYDVDDANLEFAVSGVSGGRLNVTVNAVSQIATITPDPNWCGQQTVTWIAADAAQDGNSFDTTFVINCLNDPPRATDTKLERIIFEEGSQTYINLSGHFYDFDGEPLRYYAEILDPVAAQYIRINNSQLVSTDPYMRVYVDDRYRQDYFTPGAVQVRFFVLDASGNCDPTGYCPEVSKTTFIEIINVNDAPIVDDVSPTPEEVATTEWFEGNNITFSVTQVTDPDNKFYPTDLQFFYKWFVNGEEVAGESGPTFVFKTVLDATRPGQYDEGNYTVSVQVFDAAGAKASLEPEWAFQILKANRAPSAQIIRPTAPIFDEGAQIEFQALASDADPEDSGALQVTWIYTDASGKASVLGTGDRLRMLLEPGNYTITVRVSDGLATTESVPIHITVRPHVFNTPGLDLGPAAGALALAAVVAAALARAGARRRGG